MLKSTVPTDENDPVWTGGLALASIVNTSLSGSENLTPGVQFRPSRSSHRLFDVLNLTIRPVSGPVTPSKFVFGAGSPPGIVWPPTVHEAAAAPPLQTAPSLTVVV